MSQLRVLYSETHDPWFNLATEDWIFKEMSTDSQVLFLWRNADTVVIGRYQNPWTECNLEAMERDGVKLARRQSGGGAVFHDLGNTNFTFLSPKDSYSKERNFSIIVRALASLGIQAEVSGRNDILVDGRKVSGSAFKLSQDRAFHHGTLLIDTDLNRLSGYLTPHPKKLSSKGINSVKSRVANLAEFNPKVDHETICNALCEAFFDTYGSRCEKEILDYRTLKEIDGLNRYFDQMRNWEWRFGTTPEFSHHIDEYFPFGHLDIYLNISGGIIGTVKVYSDSLFPELIEALTDVLPGRRYEPASVREAVLSLKKTGVNGAENLEEIADWIASHTR
ncbi:MAG TPA: lipoate--protein ligase [Spirochaetia bacterium]|nr:lipoate--protein ligase [Spirochaetia bacterium]